MSVLAEASGQGVRKLTLSVERPGENVPAVVWLPGSAGGPWPAVLLGHGGGQHKQARYITRFADGHPGAGDVDAAGFADAARRITVPVLFLMQWDDELFPRDGGLALFDRLGSPGKTLHANPGSHMQLPPAEMFSVLRFFRRQFQ